MKIGKQWRRTRVIWRGAPKNISTASSHTRNRQNRASDLQCNVSPDNVKSVQGENAKAPAGLSPALVQSRQQRQHQPAPRTVAAQDNISGS